MRPILRRAVSIAALIAVPVVAFAPMAAATPKTINYDCRGDSPAGAKTFKLTPAVEVTAPQTVAPGGALTIVIDPAPSTLIKEVDGYTVKHIEKVALKLPIPANSTYVSAEKSGGSNVGTTDFTVAGGIATITATGPIAGGSTYELPTITVKLTAAQSGKIETTLYGTSYDNPGLTATAVVSTLLGNVNVPSKCFPNPNPVFTTTTIG